jgi:hypothetical protein
MSTTAFFTGRYIISAVGSGYLIKGRKDSKDGTKE